MILAIDGNFFVLQAHFATEGRDGAGMFARRMAAVISHVQPSTVLVCFDRWSFRHDLDAGYKSDRMPDESALTPESEPAEPDPEAAAIAAALSAARTAVPGARIVEEDGAEADDCLATVAARAREVGQACVLVSPDKDLRQCLSPTTRILRSFSTRYGRLTQPDWYTLERLAADFGFSPAQLVDF